MSNVIFAKVDKKYARLVRKVAKARGENVSTFVRRAVLCELARLSYLNEDEKKALNVERIERAQNTIDNGEMTTS
ncbi:MAG: hypothetical protein ABSB40_04990 [Nitrososphaeria archaeon]|jgi:hypothetical protein